MSRRPLCHWHQSRGGCRAGNNCRFSHDNPAGATTPQSPTQATRSPVTSPQRNQNQRPAQQGGSSASGSSPPCPGGVCNFYWSTGSCKREFQCRFRHVKPGDPQANTSTSHRSTPSIPEATKAAIAPFLTEQGLARIGHGSTDGFFSEESSTSMSPTDAHTRIRRFLQDGFKFKIAHDIYAFLGILNSANSSNKLWTPEEAQLLLTNITTSDGSLRIVEILNWPEVSMRAGSSRTALSFQRGILPLLRYLSSEYVVKSILTSRANYLYNIILQNFDQLVNIIEASMQQAMDRHSFKDPLAVATKAMPIDTQVFASIAVLLHEILVRFKNVTASQPRLSALVLNLEKWFQEWLTGVNASPPLFQDPFGADNPKHVRDFVIGFITDKITRLISIVDRERRKEKAPSNEKTSVVAPFSGDAHEALVAALHTTFQGPGELHPEGPRHDNDFEDIYDIRIAPTHGELLCREPPFLPANFHSAPHHAPAESVERLLDIQFRLLREELTAPLRKAVQLVYDDLNSSNLQKTKLSSILTKQGGKYHGLSDSQESIMFNVYTGVHFQSLLAGWKGLSTSLLIDAPPGRARSEGSGARTAFWETMGGKRLIQGGLIALIWESHGETAVSLGIITSSFRDPEIKNYVAKSSTNLRLQISFFDPTMEIRILQSIRSKSKDGDGLKLLVESPVMFEAVRPFLEALKAEPEDLPFSKYLVHRPLGFLKNCGLEPPKYTRLPNFSFQLASLFPAESGVEDLKLVPSDPASVDKARTQLRKSKLDPSQADAVVDALTREVSLIQGPPGTGKSYTGVEILRVLRENKIGPILMIAFTNHALDHMLTSVLDAGITYRIIRLGSRSSDERIRNYSIETLEMAQNTSRLDKAYSQHRRALKDLQKQIEDLMQKLINADVEKDSTLLMDHVQSCYPEHHDFLISPPPSITMMRQIITGMEGEDDSGWQTVGKGGRVESVDDSLYGFWKEAQDQAFLMQVMNGTLQPWPSPPPSPSLSNAFATLSVDPGEGSEDGSEDEDLEDDDFSVVDAEDNWASVDYALPDQSIDIDEVHASPLSPNEDFVEDPEVENDPTLDIHDIPSFLAVLGYHEPPQFSSTDRSLAELLEDGADVWNMNIHERRRLHQFWAEETRRELAENQEHEFKRLRELHEQRLTECNEGQAEARRNLLQSIDIIGCTTTGAAKLTSLLKALNPRVLLVEEAGQVMEAHILGSLVPSIEHLILIGDPLQLRPTLNNYSLSMDSRRGRELYRFDMSLMERLSTSGLAMSRIDVQRRMRPTISSLIRNTLYPGLEDHHLVREYPDVRGMGKNVFFLNHTNPENDGGDEATSKFNTYEVKMIRDLVLYLLRQGCYSDEGDIVVLCAYLGQLARLRDALAGEIAVIIDERDQADLNDAEDSADENPAGPSVERVNVTRRVRLRTVDNYQGEEGRIVILSLVRNAGDPEDDVGDRAQRSAHRSTIGFLKSENRTNVALSRAKEGLYILGNAENLANHSKMWNSIIQELADIECLGPALPIACHQHPEAIEWISTPGQLGGFAPDGGCLRPCDARLPCGHLCPYKCHPDDPNHLSVVCGQQCRRLCALGHPCSKVCSVDCGQCRFPVSDVQLPCGHVKSSVPCWQLESLESVFCDVVLEKALPSCEHTAMLSCGMDASTYSCNERCDMLMACCSKACSGKCNECQGLSNHRTAENSSQVPRTSHRAHPCEKDLQCGHRCQEMCSEGHQHTTKCMQSCRQTCRHAQCRLPCHAPCVPCQERCTWSCPHYTCPVSCGSICVRLPCDKRCTNQLKCGHPCPSVCGEDCSIQVCPECASPNQKSAVVDLILSRTLEDLVPESDTLDELIITIPSCRHVFTVETLDGIAFLRDFYSYNDKRELWTGLTSPSGLVKPPTCPTCRAAITSPRYGRVTKRADLDILERNVAGEMSRSLNKQIEAFNRFNEQAVQGRFIEQQASLALKMPKSPPKKSLIRNRSSVLENKSDLPISERDINPANASLFFIDQAALDIWRKATQSLYMVYQNITKISQIRSAHSQAWESAFSFLYEREIQRGISNPSLLPRHIPPHDHALRVARLQVGQPRPLADRRFLVEAFWSSIEIRLKLARLGMAWLDAASEQPTKYISFHRDQWAVYVQFLHKSCVCDAEKAFDLAKDSASHRQQVKCSLICMRTKIERFRFNFLMHKKTNRLAEHREELLEKATELEAEAGESMRKTLSDYLGRGGIDLAPERAWIKKEFADTAQLIVDEWMEITRSLRMDTFYQPVSYEEKMEIVKAMDFSTTGHFYTCPAGHVFSIGDCGGATMTSRCPECGALIGGHSHRIDSSNRQATEFDTIQRTLNPGIRRGYAEGGW